MVEVIFLGLGLGLIVIGMISILVAGVRNVTLGKSSPKKVSVMVVPFIIFGIAYASTGSVDQGGIATMMVLIGAMLLAIAFTGLKGTFKL
ncbi:MAG: hypothetical protein WEC12_04950 [Balneolaceae bacterium]